MQPIFSRTKLTVCISTFVSHMTIATTMPSKVHQNLLKLFFIIFPLVFWQKLSNFTHMQTHCQDRISSTLAAKLICLMFWFVVHTHMCYIYICLHHRSAGWVNGWNAGPCLVLANDIQLTFALVNTVFSKSLFIWNCRLYSLRIYKQSLYKYNSLD